MTELIELFDEAVEKYAPEVGRLCFLPENRYNTAIFPYVGQYDWLSGQLLYCLVRYLRPVRVIEVSTGSGYSSLFSALALKANGYGQLETFELLLELAAAARGNFERFGVTEVVRLHVGDARETVSELLGEGRGKQEREILFLDSEHTDEFARFFLDTFLPGTHPESLFHMHDTLPPKARVMYRPLEAMNGRRFWLRTQVYWTLRRLWPRLVAPDLRCWIKPVPFDPASQSSEARLRHKLSAQIASEAQVCVHDLIDRYPLLDGRRYDRTSVWRCDSQGKPMEWNESWWAICGPLARAYLSRELLMGAHYI